MTKRFGGKVVLCTALVCFLFTACAGVKKVIPGLGLREGVVLPAVTALAWFSPESSPGGDEDRFAAASADGFIRIWDTYEGRELLCFSTGGEKIISLAFNGNGTELVSVSGTGESRNWDLAPSNNKNSMGEQTPDSSGNSRGTGKGGTETIPVLPVFSPDGTKKLYPASDGAVCLADSVTEKTLAKYYSFGNINKLSVGEVSLEGMTEGESGDEWVSIVPSGFYNTSSSGSSFLVATAGDKKYRLDQLSGALFRPDLFYSTLVGEKFAAPENLESLFEEEKTPPLISASFERARGRRELRIKVIAQKGGAGKIALFRQSGALDIPIGYLDTEKTAEKKYTEKGKTCYEMSLNLNRIRSVMLSSVIGLSVFNASNTIESDRIWVQLPSTPIPSPVKSPDAHPPVLKLLFAGPEGTGERAGNLEKLFAQQSGGDLFSSAEVKELYGDNFTPAGFIKALEDLAAPDDLSAETDQGQTLILYIRGVGIADALGNLGIAIPAGDGNTGSPGGNKSGNPVTNENVIP
ncbi:MAG: WD40 repeat domain-containing protein, partial [Treponema sp.]|nr:WD40 repeat domain-containing protein [Treponema sp.]